MYIFRLDASFSFSCPRPRRRSRNTIYLYKTESFNTGVNLIPSETLDWITIRSEASNWLIWKDRYTESLLGLWRSSVIIVSCLVRSIGSVEFAMRRLGQAATTDEPTISRQEMALPVDSRAKGDLQITCLYPSSAFGIAGTTGSVE